MNPQLEKIFSQAKSNIKKIILVEPQDERVLKAAKIATDQKIADITLLDQNTEKHPLFSQFVDEFFQLRKDKGITIDQAQEIIKNPLFFGAMMLYSDQVDGMVAGANNTSQETFRPALQIIKAKPQEKLLSSFFLVEIPNQQFGQNGLFIFSDCGLNIDPNSEQLAEIAIQSSKSFKQLIGDTPKIAMLSYSTNGSGNGPSVDKVNQAVQIIKQKEPKLIVEGEIQADAALVSSIAIKKFPQSQLLGQANILIFPNLDAGNIAYKLVEKLANGHAFGPLIQGINKPLNDLSRGCTVDDIVTTIAITSVQAQFNANW